MPSTAKAALLSRCPGKSRLALTRSFLRRLQLSLHLHQVESLTTGGIPQFDFTLRTCRVECEGDQPFSTSPVKLTSLERQTVKEMDSMFYIKILGFANFYESLIHVVDQYRPMEIYCELKMQTTYVMSKFSNSYMFNNEVGKRNCVLFMNIYLNISKILPFYLISNTKYQ